LICETSDRARPVSAGGAHLPRELVRTVPVPKPTYLTNLAMPVLAACLGELSRVCVGADQSRTLPALEVNLPLLTMVSLVRTRPEIDVLDDHQVALKFGEGGVDVEEQFALRRGRVEVLPIEVEIDADILKVLDCIEQMDE
jgi:hypothetical protein